MVLLTPEERAERVRKQEEERAESDWQEVTKRIIRLQKDVDKLDTRRRKSKLESKQTELKRQKKEIEAAQSKEAKEKVLLNLKLACETQGCPEAFELYDPLQGETYNEVTNLISLHSVKLKRIVTKTKSLQARRSLLTVITTLKWLFSIGLIVNVAEYILRHEYNTLKCVVANAAYLFGLILIGSKIKETITIVRMEIQQLVEAKNDNSTHKPNNELQSQPVIKPAPRAPVINPAPVPSPVMPIALLMDDGVMSFVAEVLLDKCEHLINIGAKEGRGLVCKIDNLIYKISHPIYDSLVIAMFSKDNASLSLEYICTNMTEDEVNVPSRRNYANREQMLVDAIFNLKQLDMVFESEGQFRFSDMGQTLFETVAISEKMEKERKLLPRCFIE